MLVTAAGFSLLQRTIAIDIGPFFLIGMGFGVMSGKSSSIRWSLALTAFYLIAFVIAAAMLPFRFEELRFAGRPLLPITKMLIAPVFAVEFVWLMINLRLLRRCFSPVACAG